MPQKGNKDAKKQPIKVNDKHPTGKAINKHNAALQAAFNASGSKKKKKKDGKDS